MMEPVQFSNESAKKPEVVKPWALTGCLGRQPNIIKSLLLGDGALEAHNKKLQGKFNKMKESEVRAEAFHLKESEIILVAYGSVARIAKSAMIKARLKGLKVGLIRPITLWPFPDKLISDVCENTKKMLVVEMNAGQMVEDVKLAACGKAEIDFYGRMGGGIPTDDEILERLEALI
jgi:2-oxoglutarate ferredoxin oxidoreductase subunit alpha